MDWHITASGALVSIIPSGRLPTNRQYTVLISPTISGVGEGGSGVLLGSSYSFWFTSAYCPIFTTVTRVRLQAGPVADNLIDDTIYRMIMKNSIDAVDLVSTAYGQTIAYDYWGCCWQNVPPIIKMYVECKTAYDILALIELSNNSGGAASSQRKQLGDMAIAYGGPSAAASAVDPGKKKQMYDCWMEMLRGIKSLAINSAVRGWFDTSKGYPHPVYDGGHNRVIRGVSYDNSNPTGPWENAKYWRRVF